jgi:hypothetical protein
MSPTPRSSLRLVAALAAVIALAVVAFLVLRVPTLGRLAEAPPPRARAGSAASPSRPP